jgi:hypothetical protein
MLTLPLPKKTIPAKSRDCLLRAGANYLIN